MKTIILLVFGTKMQASLSFNLLNALRMWFNHFLPKAMFPCHLCHRSVVACNCWNMLWRYM